MQILHSSSCFRVFHFGAFLCKASHGRRKISEVENLKKYLNLPCKTIVICLTDDYDESLLFFPKQTTYTTYYLTHITHRLLICEPCLRCYVCLTYENGWQQQVLLVWIHARVHMSLSCRRPNAEQESFKAEIIYLVVIVVGLWKCKNASR